MSTATDAPRIGRDGEGTRLKFSRRVDGLELPHGEEDADFRHHVIFRRWVKNPAQLLSALMAEAGQDWNRERQNEYKTQELIYLEPAQHVRLFQALERTVLAINERAWGLDLTYWHTARLNLYPEGSGRHDWHSDYLPGDLAKLAFTLLLKAPEEGGALRLLANRTEPVALAEGDLAVFPAYEPHMVDLVTKGTRVSLTGWLGGPALR